MPTIREALVLAGGLGTRLSKVTGGKPKYLVRIRGLPLTLYPMLVLRSLGVEKFVVVIADRFLADAKRELSSIESLARIRFVANPRPELENGYSLALGVPEISSDTFAVTVADHIYSRRLASGLLDHGIRDASVVVGGDPSPAHVDVGEATKILALRDGKLLYIGKSLYSYTHVDVGLFLFRKSVFGGEGEPRSPLPLSQVILRVSKSRTVKVASLAGLWTDVDTPEDLDSLLWGPRRVVLETVLGEIKDLVG